MTAEESLLRADRILNLTVSPLMMLLSLIGNILAFLIFWRSSFSTMPMSVYLRFLAIMDAGTVVTGLLPRFLLAVTDYDIRGRNEVSCQFQVYAVYVFTELSAWTLVIVTSERVMSIIRPHRVKILCTKIKSYVILSVVSVIIMLANSPIFVFFGKQAVTESTAELYREQHSDVLSTNSSSLETTNTSGSIFRPCGFRDTISQSGKTWFLTHFVKQSLLPFILILTLNSIIILALIRRRSALLKSCAKEFNSPLANKDIAKRPTEGVYAPMMSRKDASLSVTLVAINIVFLMCNFPIGIYQQIVFNLPDRYENSDQSLVYSVLVFCLYLNNTLNFILYSTTGSRFRKELRNMFLCSS
ncbi:unnamed protein product [Candidula unifasciata]|uniref:G-protein coupled receptors family 1 profile domain-containing protein n=1 Tax=Candidula unifasciata TaxID=100452 RepID=A0A8S3Z3U5_9EUPU|nr:unnamed protein product [Candidula unifasciata]